MKQQLSILYLLFFSSIAHAELSYETKLFTWKEDIPNKIIKEEGIEFTMRNSIPLTSEVNYHLDASLVGTHYTGTMMWTNEKKTAVGFHIVSNLGLDYQASPSFSLSPNIDFRVRTIDNLNTVEKMIEPGLKVTYTQEVADNQKVRVSLNQPFKQYLFTFAGTFHPKTKHPHLDIEWQKALDKNTTFGVNAGLKSWAASEKKQYNHEGKNVWIYQPAIASETFGLSFNHLW